MCEWLDKILEKKEVWALIGVFFGAILSVFLKWISDKIQRRRIKAALFDELDTNNHIILQKKDILNKMIHALSEKKVLRGESVHFAFTIYKTHIVLLSEFLKPKERDNLHVIYERLKINDKFMDEFETRIIKEMESKGIKNPWSTYKIYLQKLDKNLDTVKSLITDFLNKKPQDVFQRHKKP